MKFPLVTVGDLSFRLLLLRPNWSTAPAVTYRMDTTIGEGRTTIEERRPGRAAFLLSQKVALTLQGNDLDDWRKGLAALGERLVAMPLWVDAVPVAQWADRIHAPQKVLNFDPESGAYAIHDATALPGSPAYSHYAPLMLGRWSKRPPASSDEDDGADVSLELVEARPWSWRIGVNVYGAGWTQLPNRLSPAIDASEYGLELIQLPGAAAAPATDRTNAAARWRQEGEFTFVSREEIRRALTVFADKRGAWGTIAPLPAWLQPGASSTATPDNYTARFASDRLTLAYGAQDFATSRIAFLQEVSTPGRDQALPGEAYLYQLEYDHDTGNPELLTNWDQPLTCSEGDYEPFQVSHTDIVRSLRPQDERAEIRLAFVAGSLAADWMLARLFGPVRLKIWKCDPADAAGTRGAPLFTGFVESVEPDGNLLLLRASLLGEQVLERRAPGWNFGRYCNTWIFSPECGKLEADHDSAGTLSTIHITGGGKIVTVESVTGWGGPAYPENHFAGGELRTGSGRTTQIATILSSEPAAFGFVELHLNRPLWADLVTDGQAVTLLPGCGGRFVSDCGDRYNNQENFRGFEHAPEYIEARALGAPPSPKK